MAYHEDLSSDPSKWKKKLLYVDSVTTKFQKKEQENRSNSQGKKPGLEDRVELRGGELGSAKTKCKFVPKKV